MNDQTSTNVETREIPENALNQKALTRRQQVMKRAFDLTASSVMLMLTAPLILIGWVAATVSTGASGFFVQQRIGLHGEKFPLLKLRTMKIIVGVDTTVSSSNDCRITRTGRILRKLKIDELPQLLNVLAGHMSLVGPRPDVPGFADELAADDRILLSVRPGITGPASIRFRNEEELLSKVADPETYNREVIWPEKVRINIEYLNNYSFAKDLQMILATVIPALESNTRQ